MASLQRLPTRPQLLVGVTFYNDITNTRRNPVQVIPLQPPDRLDWLISQILNHRVSAGGDPREMVFHGITQAIDQAGFRSDRLKMLIVIGDDGDKSDENDPQHPQENQIVGQLIRNYTTPISFVAIQVYPQEKLTTRPPVMAFWEQMNTISQFYNSQLKHSEMNISSFIPAIVYNVRQANEVVILILEAFQSLVHQQEELHKQITELQLGNFSAVREDSCGSSHLSVFLRSHSWYFYRS